MATQRLTASQFVPRPREEVFRFFADPQNLRRLTPPSMGFDFRSDDFEMREGLEVSYRIKPLLGVPLGWHSLIEDYDPPNGFRDIQLRGPYRRWEHRHTFREVTGGTQVEDEVIYELPFGPLGSLAHGLLVRAELQEIFKYRARAIERIFAVPATNERPLTVAVAGGTGFVGGAVARELFRRGHRVVVLSSRGEEARGELPDSVEIRAADVTAPDDLAPALAGVDALVIALAFHNLPIEAPRRGQTFENVDARGTERLLAAAAESEVRSVTYMSGAGAASDARRHWFRAKWRAEEAVRASGLRWTIIRPTWIYGPRDVSLNRFVGFARRLQLVPLTNFGRQPLAPAYVEDVARLTADALTDRAADCQVFEIGGPEVMSMREVIGRALKVAGIRRPILPGPTPLIKLGALPLTLLPQPPLSPAAIDFVNQPATVDLRPLLERMPRRLTTLEEGLAEYLPPDAGPAELRFEQRPGGG